MLSYGDGTLKASKNKRELLLLNSKGDATNNQLGAGSFPQHQPILPVYLNRLLSPKGNSCQVRPKSPRYSLPLAAVPA